MKKSLKAAALFMSLASASAALAAARPAQFVAVGQIEEFTITDPSDPLSDAHMVVHGTDIIVPKNLIIQMPASYLTPADIFSINHQIDAARPATESGLAIKDTKPPVAHFEATVVGNIVGNQNIAGLIWISQHSLATGAGYIKDIAPDGEIHLVADSESAAAQPITRVRINDPDQIYAPADPNQLADKRFMVDTENPTIHALTGFPMCVPRSAADPECPQGNRPKDAANMPLTAFVMRAQDLPGSPAGELDIKGCAACDPTKQAPFQPGDYVLYSGTLAKDASGLYISAHTMEANVAIFTAPGVNPAYVFVEGSLIGAQGPMVPRNPANPAGPFLAQETQDRLKVEGITTDPSRRIEVYAVDVAADGTSTLRLFEVVPAQDAPFGRYRLIHGARANALFDKNNVLKGAARELMARVEDLATVNCDPANPAHDLDGCPVPDAPLFAHGLVAGQYVAPFGEFIFPENKVGGDPILPNNFECLPFLLVGSGPLTTNGRDQDPAPDPMVGQLNPWPGLAPPAAIECGPKPKL